MKVKRWSINDVWISQLMASFCRAAYQVVKVNWNFNFLHSRITWKSFQILPAPYETSTTTQPEKKWWACYRKYRSCAIAINVSFYNCAKLLAWHLGEYINSEVHVTKYKLPISQWSSSIHESDVVHPSRKSPIKIGRHKMSNHVSSSLFDDAHAVIWNIRREWMRILAWTFKAILTPIIGA